MWSAHSDMNCCPAGAPNSVAMAAVRSLVLPFSASAAAVKSGLFVAPARSAATASATCSPSSRSSSERSRQDGCCSAAAWSGGSSVAASACPMLEGVGVALPVRSSAPRRSRRPRRRRPAAEGGRRGSVSGRPGRLPGQASLRGRGEEVAELVLELDQLRPRLVPGRRVVGGQAAGVVEQRGHVVRPQRRGTRRGLRRRTAPRPRRSGRRCSARSPRSRPARSPRRCGSGPASCPPPAPSAARAAPPAAAPRRRATGRTCRSTRRRAWARCGALRSPERPPRGWGRGWPNTRRKALPLPERPPRPSPACSFSHCEARTGIDGSLRRGCAVRIRCSPAPVRTSILDRLGGPMAGTMTAARFYEPGKPLRVEEVPVPRPAADEVLVRVATVGPVRLGRPHRGRGDHARRRTSADRARPRDRGHRRRRGRGRCQGLGGRTTGCAVCGVVVRRHLSRSCVGGPQRAVRQPSGSSASTVRAGLAEYVVVPATQPVRAARGRRVVRGQVSIVHRCGRRRRSMPWSTWPRLQPG